MSLNILNPKALERQLKILDTEIGKLQGQIDELEKMRGACLTLLGTTNVEAEKEPSSPAIQEPKKQKEPQKAQVSGEDLRPRILDLLRQNEAGMTADEIFDALKSNGIALRGKRPVALVYTTLENHPELFSQSDNGCWKESNKGVGAVN